MSFLTAVRRANRPGPPEHSVGLRIAAAGTVVTGIAATHAEGEVSLLVAALTVTLVVVGMVFSYLTRTRPRGWLKPVLALGVVIAFGWFFTRITGTSVGDISQVEAPLAVLFAWIQVTHAFDVPARRDLGFSLAGSASLMAVAGAQAVDLGFGVYVVAWLAFGLWGLAAMWRSASAGGRVGTWPAVGSLVTVAVVALVAIAVLPAPHVSGDVSFPTSAASDVPLGNQGSGVTGDGRQPSEPAKAGAPGGPSRVGGYLGFADHLDTALRPALSDQVVMRVRAQQPSFWLGETFDRWNGQSWVATDRHFQQVEGGSPFGLQPAQDDPGGGKVDLQTFYLAQYGPNLLFHAPDARQVWFPSGHLDAGSDGTLLAPITMGPGTIYTVESVVDEATPGQLRASAASPMQLPAAEQREYTQLPQSYTRVRALAESVTAGASTPYDKVEALIAWIGAHTRYSTDIPAPAPGTDAVDDFLFVHRVGFCEQISTSLAVMLRTLGIPAREAVGYVPDSFNPITDLYEVRAKDAHAWVQVWFPGYGWQSFDPTAVVPDANPSPGAALVHAVGGGLGRLPLVPIGVVLVLAVAAAVGVPRWRRRPRTWAGHVVRYVERAGTRAGRPRRPGETLSAYAAALDALAGDRSGTARSVAWMVEAAAYGGRHPTEAERQRALQAARSLRIGRRKDPGRSPPPDRATSGAGDRLV